MAVSSWVESVQFVEYTLGATSLSGSVTLSGTPDLSNCIPFMTAHGGSDYQDSHMLDIYFESTANIVFKRIKQRSNALTIRCYIVEFNPEEVRVQQGSFDLNDQITDAITLGTTLSGTDRAAMTHFWWSSSTSQNFRYHCVRGRVVNESTIDFYRNDAGASCQGHWYLFEDLKNNFRVTHHSHSYSGTGETTIVHPDRHCVDPLRTFIIGSCATNYSATRPDAGMARIFLYSDGSIRCDRGYASYTIYWAYQVVEFLDKEKIYTPFIHQLVSVDSTSTSNTLTYGNDSNRVPFAVNTDTSTIVCAMAQGVCRVNTSSTSAIDQMFVSAKLNNDDGIFLERSSSGYTAYPSYLIVVDWAGIQIDIGSNSNPIPEGNGPGKSFVKSVENFRISGERNFACRKLSKGQNWENCAVFASTSSTSGNNLRDQMANVYLVSPGIVCVKRWSTAGQLRVDISVVEFWPNQVKVQHKNTYVSGQTTTTLPIEEVSDVNKCFILSKTFTSGDARPSYSMVRVRFTDTSHVEFYKAGTSYEVDTSIFVVEDLKDNFVTRHANSSSSSTRLSFYNDDYIWSSHNSFSIASYATNYSSTRMDASAWRAGLWLDFRFDCFRGYATYTAYFTVTFVKFLDEKRHTDTFYSVQTDTTNTFTYVSNFLEEDGLTCFNHIQSSTMICSTSSATWSQAIGTIRISDYETKTVEVAKGGSGTSSQGNFGLINWTGYHYQDAHSIRPSVPTKGFIRSLQVFKQYASSSLIEAYLTKGQNIKQCIPFMNYSNQTSNADAIRRSRAIYRFEDPDCFRVRFGTAASRYVTVYIVEFNDNIKIQHGFGYSNGNTITLSIDKVDLDRAFLLFYAFSDSYGDGPAYNAVVGHFNSDEEIAFRRNSSSDNIYISWYVVECINESNYWTVQHLYETTSNSNNTVDMSVEYKPVFSKSMLLASYSHSYTSYRPDAGTYRIYDLYGDRIRFDRSYSSYSLEHRACEIIEMYTDLDFMSRKYFVGLSTTASGVYPLKLKEPIDISRSMIITSDMLGQGRVYTGSSNAWGEGSYYFWFKDNTNLVARKTGGSYTNSAAYVYQWPEYNKYFIEGYVKEKGQPVQREVALYRSSDHSLVDSAVSASGTGYFWLETPYGEHHYVVCLDDESKPDYNHLIYGKIMPTVISGSFAYNEGLTTTSGFDEGIPLLFKNLRE